MLYFPTSPSGTILVVDTKGDTVYAVKSDAFQPGGAYSASDGDGILGKVDLSTGLVSPIVTGMKSPHGALFVSALSDVSVLRSDDLDRCRVLRWYALSSPILIAATTPVGFKDGLRRVVRSRNE